jgi:CheY-like chemotaxis protein
MNPADFHILLVEDDPELQTMYKRKLTYEQFSFTIAGTGKEALQALKDKKPHLLLLDVMLPGGMNGFDILQEIKQNPDTATIPVIMMTNLSSEEEQALQMGVQEYLVKSDTPLDDLMTKIKKYLPQN